MPKNTLAGNLFAEPRFDESYLAQMTHKALGRPVAHVGFSPLQGDASTRQYYRLSVEYQEGTAEPQTLILMQLEAPNVQGETDFIRVLKFLQGIYLPVPELFHFDAERGLLLIQDCGDITLEAQLASADSATLKNGYVKAVHLLANMQTEATRAIDANCPAYHLKFDVEKLMWEMDFMLEHFIEGVQQNNLKAATRKEIRKQLTTLCTVLAEQTPCFTHRDYHSRNLMVRDDGTLKAAYYNPGPINVALAEARDKDHGLEVFVELRDVNYPGSTYTLMYDRAKDQLHGIYYQAVSKQNYEVVFVRQ